jgi:hypothetical protein
MATVNSTSHLSPLEITAVGSRLIEVLNSLRSIHRLVELSEEDPGAECYSTAVKAMTRSNFIGLDACIKKLTGIYSGDFADELDGDAIAVTQ